MLCFLGQELLPPSPGTLKTLEGPWANVFFFEFNLNLFGHLIYEHFGYFTILVAVLLLTVMAAVIIVTLALDNKQGPSVRRQVLPQRSPEPAGSGAFKLLGKSLSLAAWAPQAAARPRGKDAQK